MNRAERRFSQLTSAGVDPYNKPGTGRPHVWRYERDPRRERWAPEFDLKPYVEYVRKMQTDCERMLNQLADQLLNPGYDPYNHANGARIVFRVPQQPTRKP